MSYEFESLCHNVGRKTASVTRNPVGKLVFHIFASLAEFERDLIRERTMAGLNSARARGRLGGPKVMDDKEAAMARSMHQDDELSVKEICTTLGISKATSYRYLQAKAS